MKRVVDHKQVEMTDQEWNMYQAICESYDRPNFKGMDLFQGLFDVNGDGIIIFVHPPTKNYSSMEVYLFLISLMNNQHLRNCHEQVDNLCREAKDHIDVLLGEVRGLIKEVRK